MRQHLRAELAVCAIDDAADALVGRLQLEAGGASDAAPTLANGRSKYKPHARSLCALLTLTQRQAAPLSSGCWVTRQLGKWVIGPLGHWVIDWLLIRIDWLLINLVSCEPDS